MARSVTIWGAGPAGLMGAQVLAEAGCSVTICDHKAAPARKFLLAGRGGLNLTHSEPLDLFLTRYGSARWFLEPMIRAFPPEQVAAWCERLGISTFTGSSGRIFPVSMKASPLLRAWLRYLGQLGVTLKTGVEWPGFDDGPTVLALGGASWPSTGSTANWLPKFEAAGITVNPFQPSNSRILVPWTEHFRNKFAGQPLKNLQLRYGNEIAKGEIVISQQGLEGGAVYQLSRVMREQPGKALIIDMKPGLSGDVVAKRLAQPRGSMSQANFLRKALGLTPAAIGLLHETKTAISHAGIKGLVLQVKGPAGIERAISSAGGISLQELDSHCRLKKMPLTYCVGEMLDWDAPTGGYLLQACFSTAVAAAQDLARQLAPSTPHFAH